MNREGKNRGEQAMRLMRTSSSNNQLKQQQQQTNKQLIKQAAKHERGESVVAILAEVLRMREELEGGRVYGNELQCNAMVTQSQELTS